MVAPFVLVETYDQHLHNCYLLYNGIVVLAALIIGYKRHVYHVQCVQCTLGLENR